MLKQFGSKMINPQLSPSGAKRRKIKHVHWMLLGGTLIASGLLLGMLPDSAEATRSTALTPALRDLPGPDAVINLPLELPERHGSASAPPPDPAGSPTKREGSALAHWAAPIDAPRPPQPAEAPLPAEPVTIAPAAPAVHKPREAGPSPLPDPAEEFIEALADEPPPVEQPHAAEWREITVKRGDSLAAIFAREGIGSRELHNVLSAGQETRALVRLFPGETVRLRIDAEGRLQEVLYDLDTATTLQVLRKEDGFTLGKISHEIERRTALASGSIESSLFASAQRSGLTDLQAMELANIFGWDIDFALDIRRGDSYSVLYEELYLDGEKVGNGPILAAEFVNSGKTFRAVRFEENGEAGYYSPDGYSMRRAFLRTPVEFSRISSRFNPNRRHPVLNTIRAHRGVDYAAPTGTPVRATGSGRVASVGTQGGYGKTIVLEHGTRYTTLYAHLNGYARGIRAGSRVRQGQVIGYVGMTGLATGPHLHYEFRIDGAHRDPLTVALPKADPVAPDQRVAFDQVASSLLGQLEVRMAAASAGDTR
jgi:murein DD-endopeptidase MepM/ murein hydrolase activator NlpD